MVERHFVVLVRTEGEETITLVELAERSGCPVELAEWLVDYGLIDPVEPEREERRFPLAAVDRICRALRLKHDFELNVNALALVLELMDRVEQLEREIRRRR